jgi:hypothetical protein
MMNGAAANDEGQTYPDEFGRRVRQLTLDSHPILRRPDTSLDELIGLHERVLHLPGEARWHSHHGGPIGGNPATAPVREGG